MILSKYRTPTFRGTVFSARESFQQKHENKSYPDNDRHYNCFLYFYFQTKTGA